ncbi:MAG: amidohydrolase [Nitrospira sp. CR1.3]|nr:amidohydrolase [Nitrospira sp. CR1.3]
MNRLHAAPAFRPSIVALTLVCALTLCKDSSLAGRIELPIFDAHIHYNHDVRESVPPKEAIARLRKAGVMRALVSSSGDEGTQSLREEAPDLIIPELRPYRANGETGSWFRDDSVIEYLRGRLNRYRYVAIGEFHVSGTDADLPVVRALVQLAKRHGLMLHAHSDADAVERMFGQDSDARILWAHGGYEKPARIREMLLRYHSLWPELSSRDDMLSNGRLAEEWRAILLEFPDRFMIGTDTHRPERWDTIAANAASARDWLGELPAEVAERLAYQNGESLITAEFSQKRALRSP